MISIKDDVVFIQLKNSSYVFRKNEFNHCEQLYYGKKIHLEDVDTLINKRRVSFGSTVNLGQEYSLEHQLLEFSFPGKGDYRDVSYQINNVSHCRVESIQLQEKIEFPDDFFYPRHNQDTQQVKVVLVDDYEPVKIELFYTIYSEYDVITRHTKIMNTSDQPLMLKRLMSIQLDLFENDYDVLSLNGTWGKEGQVRVDSLQSGLLVHQSLTGASSSMSNPGLMLVNEREAYGFNLIYSGSHYNSVQKNIDGSCRVLMGYNPKMNQIELIGQSSFVTPVGVFSMARTQAKLSQQFHRFIKAFIIPQAPFDKPITYNHWEGTFFDYDHKKLLSFAKKAKQLGMELFVIDDGWFGHRNNDHCCLGDYHENSSKFPWGLKNTINEIKALGLKVGIWVEPEMVSEDSDCYRQHPDWVVGDPHHIRAKGRNQWILDLCNPEVQEYIVSQVSRVIDEYGVDYIKWDMNRHHSDQYSSVLLNQAQFDIEFQKGLVSVLKRIFNPRPQVFLEMCSSGGNRFDLGMLSIAQQIWASDNTDAMDRILIQSGFAHFYPLSAISNHVSGKVNAQTLRQNPLSSRFNVSVFGAFGYELDLNLCTKVELDEIKAQISKFHQIKFIILNGEYTELKFKEFNRFGFQVKYKDEMIVGLYQSINHGLQSKDKLRVIDLDEDALYQIASLDQALFLDRYGEILKHVMALKIHPYGMLMNQIAHYKTMNDGHFEMKASGAMLMSGLVLNELFIGTGYHPELRLWGDFGSTLYHIKKVGKVNE